MEITDADDGDDVIITCSRCKESYHVECVGLEGVPRACIHPDYLCNVCIRPDESNFPEDEKEVVVPESLSPKVIVDIVSLAKQGLTNDGAHHKQGYLEDILVAILGTQGYEKLKMDTKIAGYGWESGC